MKLTLITALALFGATGCSVALIPGAEKVVITNNPTGIVNCKIVGKGAWMHGSTGAKNESKNNILIKGGDTLLITSSDPILNMKYGVIYNCHGTDLRQPVPVQVKEGK